MKNILFYFTLILIFTSCEPRIKLDESQWELTAEVSNVFMYTWEQTEVSPGVTGTKKVTVSTAYEVDSENAVITLTVPNTVDRSAVSCYIYHSGESVQPLDGAPKLGKLLNWSNNSYKYRVNTAGSIYKDWTVNIVE